MFTASPAAATASIARLVDRDRRARRRTIASTTISTAMATRVAPLASAARISAR